MNEQMLQVEIPKEIANLQLPDPELLDYYRDAKERIIFFDEVVDSDGIFTLKSIIRYNLEDAGLPRKERVPIKIFINSLGGDVQVMWSLINTIKMSTTPVHTIVYNEAMSAATHILAAGHKRMAFPGATVLVHSGSCQYGGDVEKVESAKKYYDSFSKRANDLFLASTKISPKDLKKKGANDWYMTAEEALKYGIVDTVVTSIDEALTWTT